MDPTLIVESNYHETIFKRCIIIYCGARQLNLKFVPFRKKLPDNKILQHFDIHYSILYSFILAIFEYVNILFYANLSKLSLKWQAKNSISWWSPILRVRMNHISKIPHLDLIRLLLIEKS